MSASSFNENQLKAINFKTGPAMVIAGPGSGKTTVITNRIRELINSGTVNPENILVISFTNAAACEMKERFLRLEDVRDTKVTFGTFHSVFLSILKNYSDFRQFSLADSSQSVSILRSIYKSKFPGKRYTSDYFDHIIHEISKIKNGFYEGSDELKAVLPMYDSEMRKNCLMDFDDMLRSCCELLKSSSHVLEALRKRYRYLMIDEFQDINRIQFDTVRMIAAPLNNIFAVGDDDQSIYGFRGSDPGIMLSFIRFYPDAEFIDLFTNYRSSENIITASSRLISNNRLRYKKHLSASGPKGEHIHYLHFYDQNDEAEYICRSIAGYDSTYRSFGILFRTHKAGKCIFSMINSGRYSEALKDKDIKLMTFHSSKGLEFDVVYIIAADEGVIPPAGADLYAVEEERRLFYVAMTRAKKVLHISYTKYIYNNRRKMSRFVKETYLCRILKFL